MEKHFKDPVHGYIAVPADWCTDFIDTPIFQRLRHIEQTSMRPLYPAAHHDRFVHSLGTYHLARKIFQHLAHNTKDTEICELLNEERIQNTFLITCLMHDCGHAPFSHTFEKFYNYTEAKTTKRAYALLAAEFPGRDFKVQGSFDPAPHEAFSAVVLNRFYKDQLKKYGCDPELAARMITGCTYPDARTAGRSLENSLISLLNGSAIDVDKLDYILRDTWASGVKNTAVDIDRLLSAAVLHADPGGSVQLCYRKSALSVLQHVVDARNYLYEWVYNHHTVLYYSELLDRSLRELAKFLATDQDPDVFWKAAFSLEPFEGQTDLGANTRLYLPTDGDILHLLKRFEGDVPLYDVAELLAHTPKRAPLWKTCAEFRMLFRGAPVIEPDVCMGVAERLPQLLSDQLSCDPSDVLVVSAIAKHYVIGESHVHVLMKNRDGSAESSRPFTDLIGERSQRDPINFFYVFLTPTYASKTEAIVETIRAQRR